MGKMFQLEAIKIKLMKKLKKIDLIGFLNYEKK
jgi:hypothetical protein